MPKRKADRGSNNYEEMLSFIANDGVNFDTSDDDTDLVNIPPDNDLSEDEEEANKKITQENSVQNILGRVEVELRVEGNKVSQSQSMNLSQSPSLTLNSSHSHTQSILASSSSPNNSQPPPDLKQVPPFLPQGYQNLHPNISPYKVDNSFGESGHSSLHSSFNHFQPIPPPPFSFPNYGQHPHGLHEQPYIPNLGSLTDHTRALGDARLLGDARSLGESSRNLEEPLRSLGVGLVDHSRQDHNHSHPPHGHSHTHSILGHFEHPSAKRICIEPDWRLERPVYTRWHSHQPPEGNDFLRKNLTGIAELSPVEVFEKLFTDEILDFIRIQTLTYAVTVKKDNAFSLDDHEFKGFLGILLYNSYVVMPNERMYWSTESTVGQKLVKNAMTRNDYRKIKSFIQLYDRSNPNKERGFKVKALISMLNKSFQRYGIFDKNLTIDKFTVKLGDEEKFFLKRKPKKCGYRIWAMCGEEGYCYKFDLYCGDDRSNDQIVVPDTNLGTKVVLNMAEALKHPNEHFVFFDKFFTSRDLLQTLRDKNVKASGGIKENRIPNCNIKQLHVLSGENPGAFDHRFDKNGELLVVRWHGNKCVSMMTNYDDIKPSCIAKYYNVSEKLKTSVTQPKCVKDYMNGSRGVALFDWFLNKHDIKIRSRKWHWCLFTKILDMAVTNAWILHKTVTKSNKVMPLLEFRREIAESYLKAAGNVQRNPVGRPRNEESKLSKQLPRSLRFDGMNHYIKKNESGKRNRCQGWGCSRKTLTRCSKCNIAMCLDCFAPFHMKH